MAIVLLRSAVRVVTFRLALIAALPLVAGCAMQYSARSLGVPVTMAEPLAQPVPGDSFNITLHAVHYFWGLAPGRAPSLQHALAGQLLQQCQSLPPSPLSGCFGPAIPTAVTALSFLT